MKKSLLLPALLAPLLAALFLGPPVRDDHMCSPAFSTALDEAIERLEGAAMRTTAAFTPSARAGHMDLTTDPYTCEAADPYCESLTVDDRPCFTLAEAEPTCDHDSPTCDPAVTCFGFYTCDSRSTCDGTPTCNAEETCWNSTCMDQGQTCDGVTPTCDQGTGCTFTMDGTHTCNGSPTCYSTCEGFLTCDATCQGQTCEGGETCEDTCEFTCYNSTCNETDPECWVGTSRTSWGGLKKQFR